MKNFHELRNIVPLLTYQEFKDERILVVSV